MSRYIDAEKLTTIFCVNYCVGTDCTDRMQKDCCMLKAISQTPEVDVVSRFQYNLLKEENLQLKKELDELKKSFEDDLR